MKNLFTFNTPEEAFVALNKAITLDDWYQAFCKNDDGEVINFYRPDEQVRKYAAIFKSGGFNSENSVPNLLRSAISTYLRDISEWLCTPRTPSFAVEVKFEYPVGYTLESAEAEKIASDTVRLVLRKDHNSGTHYGFFVSTFMPI